MERSPAAAPDAPASPASPEDRLARWARSSLPARGPELLAACAGLACLLALGGGRALSPTRLDFAQGDWPQHILGWLFFRRAPWALPVGALSNYAWPVGGTVAMTDANPWLAVAGKLLSPLLPETFQYVGLWLALCFALQGWVGARLVGLASSAPEHRALGGALVALSPALAWRVAHDTLCAHFVLLAGLFLLLRPVPDAGAARRASRGAVVLVAFAAGVHPYLAAMSFVLGAALLLRLARERLLRGRALAQAAALLLAAPAALFVLFGELTGVPGVVTGFGELSSDLLALVDPMNRSWLLRGGLGAAGGQVEGFAWLGAGGLALSIAAGLLLARSPRRVGPAARVRIRWALAASGLLFAYALSRRVTVAGRAVADLYPFYQHLMNVTGPLRASGRFAWPLHHLLLAGGACGVAALAPSRRLATALLAAGVALQAVDLIPATRSGLFDGTVRWPRAAAWESAAGRYDAVAVYPPNIFGADVGCRDGSFAIDAWAPAAFVAYRLGVPVNSGYLARVNGPASDRACEGWRREVEAGVVRRRTIYVVSPAELPRFRAVSGVRCGELDGLHVCVLAGADDPFARELERAHEEG